ncbi:MULTISPECIES: acyl-CoA thioesterase [unclassified Moraxella]|uniref:acyl-CoA thioesterase n=1 Tax=unclassified Moraxella TaxID=2685852 RepID=UPI003AF65B4A
MPQDAIAPHIRQATSEATHPLHEYAVVYIQAVEWGDMDAFNHVNNVVYYEYAQRARIHYLEQVDMFNATTFTVLASSSCQYLRPVTYPDTLWIGIRAKKVGNTSLVHEYVYYSTAQHAVVATLESVLVFFDEKGEQKQAISDKQRADLTALESNHKYSIK